MKVFKPRPPPPSLERGEVSRMASGMDIVERLSILAETLASKQQTELAELVKTLKIIAGEHPELEDWIEAIEYSIIRLSDNIDPWLHNTLLYGIMKTIESMCGMYNYICITTDLHEKTMKTVQEMFRYEFEEPKQPIVEFKCNDYQKMMETISYAGRLTGMVIEIVYELLSTPLDPMLKKILKQIQQYTFTTTDILADVYHELSKCRQQ